MVRDGAGLAIAARQKPMVECDHWFSGAPSAPEKRAERLVIVSLSQIAVPHDSALIQHSCHQGQTETLTFRILAKGRSAEGQIEG
jgi:hypothetical protein